MSERAQVLAERLERTNRHLMTIVERVPDERWKQPSTEEERPVGVIAHHVASTYAVQKDLIRATTSGSAPAVTWEMIDQMNEEHARQHEGCARAETLDLLRAGGADIADTIRGLHDEHLRHKALFPFLSPDPVTVEQFIEAGVIGHVEGHLPSIAANVEQSTITA